MTVQEIHEYIWGEICRALSRPDGIHRMVIGIKVNAVGKLYDSGRISRKSRYLLFSANSCVLCALYQNRKDKCARCPLYRLANKHCDERGTLYQKVLCGECREDILTAARAIKNTDVLSGEYDEWKKEILEEGGK